MTANELTEALAEAKDLPDGDGKIAELERIVACADASGALRTAFDARLALIDTYHNHTEHWRMSPAFDWCLSTFDRSPELFDNWDAELLRWYHKRAVATLHGTPQIGLAQTQAALDDLERRFRAGGQGVQAVYHLRCTIADHVGDEAQARHWLDRWRSAPRDENSDCAGCAPSRQAELLAGWGDWAEAVATAEPVLSGAIGCIEQPEKALVAVLLPYLRLGRHAEAGRAHVRAYRRHRRERDSFPLLAEHLRFCALTRHHERGLAILTEHLGWFDRPYDDASAMEFAATAALVCRLAVEAGLGGHTLHRPEHGRRPAAEVSVAVLGTELAAAARDLAARFDDRNGTGHQSARIESWLAAEPLTDPFELPPDEPQRDAAGVADLPAEGVLDVVAPLTVEAVTAALNERGDRYVVDPDRRPGLPLTVLAGAAATVVCDEAGPGDQHGGGEDEPRHHRVPLGVDHALQITVDEPVVDVGLAGPASGPVLGGGQRATHSGGGHQQTPCRGGQVQPDGARPVPGQEATGGQVGQEAEVQDQYHRDQ